MNRFLRSRSANNTIWDRVPDKHQGNNNITQDPELDNEFVPGRGSPAIGTGIKAYVHKGVKVFTISNFHGEGPDMAARTAISETISLTPFCAVVDRRSM